MKVDLNSRKAVIARFVSFWFQTIVVNYSLKKRSVVLVLMTALLMPVFYFADWRKASAQSFQSTLSFPRIPTISAPPEQFYYSVSDSIQATTLAAVSSVSETAVNVSAPVVNFFTPPKPPLGFEMAKTVSPASKMISSFTLSISSFLGFFAPSSANKEENSEAESASANMVFNQPAANVDFDFDGDGKGDVSRFHPATGEWRVLQSSNGSLITAAVGSSSSIIAPGDFNGDGKTDYGVFNAGSWTIRLSGSGTNQTPITFGAAGDKPVVGDYNGDGISDLAYYRPSNNTWNIRSSAIGNPVTSTTFGAPGDITVQADYDGDAKTDIAVFRPSGGNWHILKSGSGYWTAQYGVSSDVPVPADYDADGKTDIAVFRGTTGAWFILKSSDGVTLFPVWGNYGDQPVPADYDGDGQADVAVYRPANGGWHIYKTSSGYYNYSLGLPDDIPVPSAYIRQIGSEIHSYDFAKTRLSPKNATGGTDLYSRNFSWGTSLVNLPGRAGLDAGLGISYNSLVWTKHNDMMVFDGDTSNVSPGFRLGFPTIEPGYYDSGSGKFNYLMVTPSGARVEFKQFGASDTYETADSSYAQLKLDGGGNPNSAPINLTITVRTTDGTQMFYSWIAGAYRCTKIMDRNGNFITIGNDAEYGVLRTITDTLGRIIYVNYDSELSPTSITQWWQASNGSGAYEGHTYATFNYTTVPVNPNFSTSGVYGPSGNIKGLQSIVYSDGSSTRFDYNSYGQVYKVSNYAADSTTFLNHVRTDLQSPSGTQADCPRFTQTISKVKNFNQNTSNVEQETVVTNTIPVASTVPGTTDPASMIQVSMAGHPNNLVSKTYVGASGWKEGLPLATEDWEGSTKRRWTQTSWTQDNTNLTYILNPRVTETKVGDATNTKRTAINYHLYKDNLGQDTTIAKYGLVKEVLVYGSDQLNVWKKSVIDYKTDPVDDLPYLSRRIIGLPVQVLQYGRNDATSQLEYVSKVTYGYDEENFTKESNQVIPVTKHETGYYSSSFFIGRGNLTSTTRHSVDSTDLLQTVTSKMRYDIAGSVVASITPDPNNPTGGRKVSIDYTDNFNDSINRNSFAYPKILTDPAEYSSEVKYRYDIGANVEAKSPDLDASTPGKKTARLFDEHGRIKQQTLVNSGAYTRYVYPTTQTETKVFTTVTDTNGNNTGDTADEVLTESFLDGAGRTIKSRTPMTFSSTGATATWVGQKVKYDVLGRVVSQSTPTEIDANWDATGTDLTRGWQWTSQEYDWKGRVTREVGLDNVDRVYSYDGCGCAGGEETTIQGEMVARDDTTGNARRTQKVYTDILGRTYKTEVLNWTGGIYTTTLNKFNGRDQVVSSLQYAGATNSQTFQEATMVYDGHGRLKSSHAPQQGSGVTTSYTYNSDDTPLTVTDGRGASSTYEYNSRGLVERIDYSLPDAAGKFPTINPNTQALSSPGPGECTPENPEFPECGGGGTTPTPTPNPQPYLSWVTFAYDPAGNRTNMTDSETGTTTYQYDQLSRMTAEHKQLRSDWSIPTHNFDITYTYNLIGQLKSVTDPFNQKIEYATDKAGKLEQITGTAYGANSSNNNQSVTSYINNIDYRAWGAADKINYGNGAEMTQKFDNRLNLEEFKLEKPGDAVPHIKKNYQYYNDGRLKFSDDGGHNYVRVPARFDRSYAYDFMGRLTAAKSGIEANGNPSPDRNEVPYQQNYVYNAFGNVTSRNTHHWTQADNQTHTWTNNRESTWTYDADGRLKQTPKNRYYYDAKGSMVMVTLDEGRRTIQHLDGEGKAVRQDQYSYSSYYNRYDLAATVYQIYSSVLGKLLTEVNSNGTKRRTFVYGMDGVVALQQYEGTSQVVRWEHTDPSNASYVQTGTNGAAYYDTPAELDPLGSSVRLNNPYNQQNAVQNAPAPGGGYGSWGDPFGSYTCMVDYVIQPCSMARQLLNSGAGEIGPLSPIAAIRSTDGGRNWGFVLWERGTNGQLGYHSYHDNSFIDANGEQVLAYGTTWHNFRGDDLLGRIVRAINLMDRVEFIPSKDGYEFEKENNNNAVRLRIMWMLVSQECEKAFKDANLPTPAEVIRDRGMTIAAAGLLLNKKNNKSIGINEDMRKAGLKSVNNSAVQAFTIVPDNPSHRIFMFFKNSAFTGESILTGDNSLTEIVPHEFVHASGVGKHDYYILGFKIGNDLTGFKDYQNILKFCSLPEGVEK